jgi:hypothetical protein
LEEVNHARVFSGHKNTREEQVMFINDSGENAVGFWTSAKPEIFI